MTKDVFWLGYGRESEGELEKKKANQLSTNENSF
jgi:hypothetical protein